MSLPPVIGAGVILLVVCGPEIVRGMGRHRDREATNLRSLIARLERRSDLDDADRADVLAARLALDSWQSGGLLTILAVDHVSFIYVAYAMLDRVWQRVFHEALPAEQRAMPDRLLARFRR
jgi:hypothetical protein